jgi:hypothetical protein
MLRDQLMQQRDTCQTRPAAKRRPGHCGVVQASALPHADLPGVVGVALADKSFPRPERPDPITGEVLPTKASHAGVAGEALGVGVDCVTKDVTKCRSRALEARRLGVKWQPVLGEPSKGDKHRGSLSV